MSNMLFQVDIVISIYFLKKLILNIYKTDAVKLIIGHIAQYRFITMQ